MDARSQILHSLSHSASLLSAASTASSPIAPSIVTSTPSSLSSILQEPQFGQYHAIYEIMSILSTKERRWQCSRVCRYWSIIVTHPFANRDISIATRDQWQHLWSLPYQHQDAAMVMCERAEREKKKDDSHNHTNNDNNSGTRSSDVPQTRASFHFVRSLHISTFPADERFISLFVSPCSVAGSPSLPMLTTLTIEGRLNTIDWNDLRHFITVEAPQLRHLSIDISELTIECHLILDLFRRTRRSKSSKNGSTASLGPATINGVNVNDEQRCGRCQQLSVVLMKCDKPGRSCDVGDTFWSSPNNERWCIPCLLDTNHRICTSDCDKEDRHGMKRVLAWP
jgi:hypothetical protein